MRFSPNKEPIYSPQLYRDIEPGYYDRVFQRGKGSQWYWHFVRFRNVDEALPGNVNRILDLGCGPGTFLGRSSISFERALGIDLAPAQIEYARSRYGRSDLEFAVQDVMTLDGVDYFDAIVSIEVIEHLPPDKTRSFLSRILSLLRPGGVLVLTTPNYRSLWPLEEIMVSRLGSIDYRVQHINRLTVPRLEQELLAAGFVEVSCKTFFVLSPFLAALSPKLAEILLRFEARLFPHFGSEIIAKAKAPSRP